MIALGVIAANLLREGGTFDFGQLLLSGDEQSGTDALKLSGDMTDGDDCELTREPS
jgi:hypothetical protein